MLLLLSTTAVVLNLLSSAPISTSVLPFWKGEEDLLSPRVLTSKEDSLTRAGLSLPAAGALTSFGTLALANSPPPFVWLGGSCLGLASFIAGFSADWLLLSGWSVEVVKLETYEGGLALFRMVSDEVTCWFS